jgi:hypothetical protein
MIGSYATYDNGCQFKVGDRVRLKRDSTYVGSIIQIEDNKLSMMVLWDDCDGLDFVWNNKIELDD